MSFVQVTSGQPVLSALKYRIVTRSYSDERVGGNELDVVVVGSKQVRLCDLNPTTTHRSYRPAVLASS
jgi:hypothetical protein